MTRYIHCTRCVLFVNDIGKKIRYDKRQTREFNVRQNYRNIDITIDRIFET